jgi:Tol biopolymer transport system component
LADINNLLGEGIAAIKRGDHATGKKLLMKLLEKDPRNEKAWLWLASCMTDVEDRRKCLLRVLDINPSNERAQQALTALTLQSTSSTPINKETLQRLRPASPEPPKQPRRREREPLVRPASGGFSARSAVVGLLAFVMLGASVFLVYQVNKVMNQTRNTAAPMVAQDNSQPILAPTFTLPPLPTNAPPTIPPFDGTTVAQPLPPTFTATPQPTATIAPTSTPTPYPQSEFVILFTSLQAGAEQPALYTMKGDGTDIRQLEADIREVAFDPTGQRIAFVRDVQYTELNGDISVYPEIFVAPFDNIAAAEAVTAFEATITGQPSWSPEGLELVFVTNADGIEDIWTYNLQSRISFNLTRGEAPSRQPVWRPVLGSREVVYTSALSTGFELFKLEVREPEEDPNIRRLTNQPNNYAPSWSANGQQIAFLSDRQGDADVFIMDAEGRDSRMVTRDDNNAEDRSPQFSPNGAYIAFISNRLDGRFNIYLITADGNVLTRLTNWDNDDIQLIYRPELFFRLSN